jgi:hypothetical protein
LRADDAPKILAAAVTAEDADRLQRMYTRGTPAGAAEDAARFEPDAASANVVGGMSDARNLAKSWSSEDISIRGRRQRPTTAVAAS